jgi:hypothetical protein
MELIVEKMNHKVFDFELRLPINEFENRNRSVRLFYILLIVTINVLHLII